MKVIYSTGSLFQSIFYFFLRICFLSVIIYSAFKFHENIILFILIILLSFVFFLATGTDSVIVYNDSVEIKNGSIIGMIRKKKRYYFTDIRDISLSGDFTTADEFSLPNIGSGKSYNNIIIKFTDNTNKIITTSVYLNQLREVIKHCKFLMQKRGNVPIG